MVPYLALLAMQDHGHTLDANGSRAGHVTTKAAIRKAKSLVGQIAPSFTTQDAGGQTVSLAALRGKPR